MEFSGWAADRGHVEYEPNKHFETASNVVSYDFPGMDPQSSGVTVAQLVGSGMMSKKTGMTKHPWVEDPEHEYSTVWEEGIDSALLASLQQNAAGGVLPVTDVARIKQLIMQNTPLEDAIIQANREAQERQAAQAPPPQEGFNTAPEQQPGLSPPGAGQETGPPPEAGHSASGGTAWAVSGAGRRPAKAGCVRSAADPPSAKRRANSRRSRDERLIHGLLVCPPAQVPYAAGDSGRNSATIRFKARAPSTSLGPGRPRNGSPTE